MATIVQPKLPFDRNARELNDATTLACHSNTLLLVAATNKTIAIPTGAKFMTADASTEAWVGVDGAFGAVPAADSTGGAAGVVLRAGAPKTFSIQDATGNINFIATGTPLINVVFW